MRRHALDALLDHMVAVLVANAFHDVVAELAHDRGLLLDVDDFQCLLDDAAAVDLQRKREHVANE